METQARCECSDPRCPACSGKCAATTTETLFRVDMDDSTGTPMCERCADDAMLSGLFCSDSCSDDDDDLADDDEPARAEVSL